MFRFTTPNATFVVFYEILQALLVAGDACHVLMAGVEGLLGPPGCLPDDGHRYTLIQCQVLFIQQVLLELCVTEPIEDQSLGHILTVVFHVLTAAALTFMSGLGLVPVPVSVCVTQLT